MLCFCDKITKQQNTVFCDSVSHFCEHLLNLQGFNEINSRQPGQTNSKIKSFGTGGEGGKLEADTPPN